VLGDPPKNLVAGGIGQAVGKRPFEPSGVGLPITTAESPRLPSGTLTVSVTVVGLKANARPVTCPLA